MPIEILDHQVGNIGYGLLGKLEFSSLTWRSEPPPEEQAFAAMRAALTAGCNFWNGGEFYGTPEHNSLTLLKKYYEKYPEDADKVVLNIKGATRPGLKPDGSPEYVRISVDNCLEMLGGRGKIHMFECARKDPNVPLEQTLRALAELVDEGKIGGVALSEVSADTIRKAAKITKIVVVEIELSLFCTEPLSNGITNACAELNIPILAYSPVGRGILTGQIKSLRDIPEHDVRRILPRFRPENFEVNIKLIKELEKIASQKKCTPAQLALGWLRTLSKKEDMPEIIPIPGSIAVDRVLENSVEIELSEDEMRQIDSILASHEVIGDRYHAAGMELANG
ncbi:Aldo/keto reductase [Glonium stellatum]|uniref:Aldo/keto reductase n=1 Tax=Glonium stellatum TaxID=574774 RepID=A0A8E2ER57_9PEZI|nr:Aldo/keto reductase [Glonium stellatum]